MSPISHRGVTGWKWSDFYVFVIMYQLFIIRHFGILLLSVTSHFNLVSYNMSKLVSWSLISSINGNKSDGEDKGSSSSSQSTSDSDRGRTLSIIPYTSKTRISKSSQTSQRVSKVGLARKQKQLQDICWVLMEALADIHAQVESSAYWTISAEQRMAQIYKEIHIASAPGVNQNVAGVPEIQDRIWRDDFDSVKPWLHARLGLDLAARNIVIGLSTVVNSIRFHC